MVLIYTDVFFFLAHLITFLKHRLVACVFVRLLIKETLWTKQINKRLMSFLGGNGPKGTMRLVLLDTVVDYIVQPLFLSIKLQCTMVTKTIVNHLKPKTNKKNPTPFII